MPSLWPEDPATEHDVGPLRLRVVAKEVLLGERIAGFRSWKVGAHGVQAIETIRAFGGELDEALRLRWLRREQAETVYDRLRSVAIEEGPIPAARMMDLWERWYGPGGGG